MALNHNPLYAETHPKEDSSGSYPVLGHQHPIPQPNPHIVERVELQFVCVCVTALSLNNFKVTHLIYHIMCLTSLSDLKQAVDKIYFRRQGEGRRGGFSPQYFRIK